MKKRTNLSAATGAHSLVTFTSKIPREVLKVAMYSAGLGLIWKRRKRKESAQDFEGRNDENDKSKEVNGKEKKKKTRGKNPLSLIKVCFYHGARVGL